jgi:SecD/SecF fusion protein
MQNKGLIKFFAILFALVVFTNFRSPSKSKMMQKSLQLETWKKQYLDSIGKESVFNLVSPTLLLTKCDKQINKGLDLEGGINVILQILLKTYWKDYRIILKTCFNKSLADATANLQGNKPFIDKFFEAFESNSKGQWN